MRHLPSTDDREDHESRSAVVRFCARDGAALRRDVIAVLAALKRAELPRLWLS